jgi:predicted GIY-YIG superfamily endonuclease
MEEDTFLYRLYGDDQRLIYLGIAIDVAARFKQHSKRVWWSRVGAATVEEFATRREALTAETAAIRSEGPQFNIAQAGDRAGKQSPELEIWADEDRAIRDARRARYLRFPEHHIHDLLAQAGLKQRRWDVPQSYHADPVLLAGLDEYQRFQLERITRLGREGLYDFLYG